MWDFTHKDRMREGDNIRRKVLALSVIGKERGFSSGW
jgi:hypothetical protein